MDDEADPLDEAADLLDEAADPQGQRPRTVEKGPAGPYKDGNPPKNGRNLLSNETRTANEARNPLFGGVIQWISLVIQWVSAVVQWIRQADLTCAGFFGRSALFFPWVGLFLGRVAAFDLA